MYDIISQKYAIMLPYMQKIEEIVSPFLKEYNLGHFWYARYYKDNSFIDLNNHPNWFQYILKRGYYDFWNDFRFHHEYWPSEEINIISSPKNFFSNISLTELNFIIENHKIFHIFNLIIKREDYLENIAFSAPIDNYNALLLYSRYFGVLKAFGFFFSHNYKSLIQEIETKNRFFLPKPISNRPFYNPNIFYQYKNREEIQIQHNIKNYFVKTVKGEIKITSRQRDCLSFLAKGYHTKEAAKYLDISAKTLEAHLSRLKDKTGLSRSTLIQAFIRSGL